MKQRLGLAIALLHDPDILILDEPTSGLDPKGIREIRETIHLLRDQGKTILLSSHLLTEIEKISTQVGILHQGKMIFQGSIEDLHRKKESDLYVDITTPDIEAGWNILYEKYHVTKHEEGLAIKINQEEDIPSILLSLISESIHVYEVKKRKSDLEKLFISMTDDSSITTPIIP